MSFEGHRTAGLFTLIPFPTKKRKMGAGSEIENLAREVDQKGT